MSLTACFPVICVIFIEVKAHPSWKHQTCHDASSITHCLLFFCLFPESTWTYSKSLYLVTVVLIMCIHENKLSTKFHIQSHVSDFHSKQKPKISTSTKGMTEDKMLSKKNLILRRETKIIKRKNTKMCIVGVDMQDVELAGKLKTEQCRQDRHLKYFF